MLDDTDLPPVRDKSEAPIDTSKLSLVDVCYVDSNVSRYDNMDVAVTQPTNKDHKREITNRMRKESQHNDETCTVKPYPPGTCFLCMYTVR